jgi:hypothetical protein
MTPPVTAMTITAYPQLNRCGAGRRVPGSHGLKREVRRALSRLGLRRGPRRQARWGSRGLGVKGAPSTTVPAPRQGGVGLPRTPERTHTT